MRVAVVAFAIYLRRRFAKVHYTDRHQQHAADHADPELLAFQKFDQISDAEAGDRAI